MQPWDRHGTDDIDEFGIAPPHASVDNAVVSDSTSVGEDAVNLTGKEQPAGEDAGAACPEDQATVAVLLDTYRQRARACGVGPSEWYEVSHRPLTDIQAYIETLEPRELGRQRRTASTAVS